MGRLACDGLGQRGGDSADGQEQVVRNFVQTEIRDERRFVYNHPLRITVRKEYCQKIPLVTERDNSRESRTVDKLMRVCGIKELAAAFCDFGRQWGAGVRGAGPFPGTFCCRIALNTAWRTTRRTGECGLTCPRRRLVCRLSLRTRDIYQY